MRYLAFPQALQNAPLSQVSILNVVLVYTVILHSMCILIENRASFMDHIAILLSLPDGMKL